MLLRLSVLLLLCLPGFSFCQSLPKIDNLIAPEITTEKVPSIALAIIDSGRIVHLKTYGYRDWGQKTPSSIHTPFHIASVSKTVTNMAVFKLVEAGQIDLNKDINSYLPFKIQNPYFPKDKISTRDLLNHRSGIKDDYEIYAPHWNEPKGDPTLKLEGFLKDYLHEDGQLYKKEHFDSSANYRSFAYSNTGVALLGLVVQHVSGMNYEDYCRQYIFEPMGMTNTSWFLKHLDASLVAKTYINQDSTGFAFLGHNGYPDYPGGQLRTSIYDYSLLISKYLNADNGQFLLKEETTSQITPNPRIAHDGFFTWFLKPMGNRLYYSHSGGDVGVRTIANMDVSNKNGIIIFANGAYDFRKLLEEIHAVMWEK